jgi:hypothetical protein
MKNNSILACVLTFVLLIAFQFLFSYLFFLNFQTKEEGVFLVQLSIDLSFIIIILGLANYWQLKLFNDFSIPNSKIFFFLILIAFLIVLIMPFLSLDYFLKNLKYDIISFNLPSTKNFFYNSYYEIFFNIRLFFIGPVLEELYFRRIIQKKLIDSNNSAFTAILIASLLFSIGHLDLNNAISAFIGGVILGYAYLKTNNIFISIMLHLFINVFIIFSNGKEINIGGMNILFVLIYPIAIFLIYLVLKRLGSLENGVR